MSQSSTHGDVRGYPVYESKPSPWTTFLLPMLVAILSSVATSAYTAGGRDSDLRHVQYTQQAHGRDIEDLKKRVNGQDVTLEGITRELKHIREGVEELRSLASGRPVVRR